HNFVCARHVNVPSAFYANRQRGYIICRVPKTAMRTLVLLLWAALVAAQSKDVAAGEKTFRSHCAPCHGMHGEGGRGPNLASGRFYHGSSAADLLKNISEGIPGTEMPGLFYMEDRIRQIIAYIRSLHVGEHSIGDGARG